MFDLFKDTKKKKKSPTKRKRTSTAKKKTTARKSPTKKKATTRRKTTLSGTRKRTTSAAKANQNRGAVMFKKIHARAKKIRKPGEDYSKTVKRASTQLKKEGVI